jgi:hypothetical protein
MATRKEGNYVNLKKNKTGSLLITFSLVKILPRYPYFRTLLAAGW